MTLPLLIGDGMRGMFGDVVDDRGSESMRRGNHIEVKNEL